jgi:hypothetical protein
MQSASRTFHPCYHQLETEGLGTTDMKRILASHSKTFTYKELHPNAFREKTST